MDKEALERIAAERAEIQYTKETSQKPGDFITFKNDKETRVLLFMENGWEKVQVPATEYDAATKTYKEISGKTQTKYNFECYDLTTYDPANPPQLSKWQRGKRDADQVLYWLEQGKRELNIMRNGQAGSKETTYVIYPANR